MKRATRLCSEQQKQRIDTAVADAESRTSAEIVPVVATASGRYDRAEDIMGLWLGAAALVVVWFAVPVSRDDVGSWSGVSTPARLGYMLLGLLGGFLLGATLAGRVHVVRRLCTPSKQMGDEVAARARQIFFDASLDHTAGGTGMLVYVSLYDRRAALLADQAILETLGQGAIDELCDELTQALWAGDVTEALCRTLQTAGDKLQAVLPRAEDDANELPDTLLTFD